ncbi:thioesterase [Actinoalloteichus sp. AHMU CJ021]|uniref:Surfactin synthase thioesterase subunit n=1 Tax=Actinoalloteichus caeruleus DSM 43889 TaxID=1120930 RepID=A0ABT1JDX5_ACTCY|nr:alpha/beta fold hydrolase [Actinoalloteichus caeruleus]AUS81190.1 thioesterase [Actinoalloteichus sp. AHMU CJ021]MCP2330618.1 Surfactin synthase thioesterase subunit [Actinoalloteichus caeruleus DSM 43889]
MSATGIDEGLWLRRFKPADPGAVRLVCLPHAGGSASFFFPMATALSPGVEVAAVQYPGRQDRRHEPCAGSVRELANMIFEVLGPSLTKPTALFGHSLGASVGFELARLMTDADAPPVHLFASGRRAPSSHRDESVHKLDDDGLLADVRALSGTDARILGDDELLRMALPAIRGDYRIAETYAYTPGPPLSCPITVLTGDADQKTTSAEAEAWAEHTTGDFEVNTFQGGHFFLTAHQKTILARMSARLAGAKAGR